MRHFKFLMFLLLSGCLPTFCAAQNFVFAQLNGAPVNTAGWNLQGAARIGNVTSANSSEIIVCPANGASGAVFYNQPINLSLCNKWKAEFDFRMYDGSGADGLAFCFLDVPPNGFVTGGGLGIPSSANGLKVCFDTWNNCIPFDPSTVHRDMPKVELRWGPGYDECNSQPTKDNSSGGMQFMNSAVYNHAKIIYDNGNIGVYVNDSLYLSGFQQFTFAGYLGFTASTGGYTDNHSIKNVIIYTEMPPSLAAAAGATTAICPDGISQLGTANTPGYLYDWSPATGLSSTNISNPVVRLPNNTANIINQVFYVKTSFSNKPGCTSVDSVNIKVYPHPTVNFLTPEICLSDAKALFTDSSFTNEPSLFPFTYRWNFGDSLATPANPNTSAAANPAHIYSAAANYKMQLFVTNNKGCADSLTKIFTVNGAVPKADFTINNAQLLCSNQLVQITNTSVVNFGTITKVEISWGDSTSVVQVDELPVAGKIYEHQYPLQQLASIKNYTISYTAYSGITCLNQVTKQVSILLAPQINFTSLPSACVNAAAMQITQAKEISGVAGSFIFSGDGVSTSGLIDPAAAGDGVHIVVASFTGANSCIDTASQTFTAWPLPLVDAGIDKFILQGAVVLLTPAATGQQLSYKWTPSLYLDNDTLQSPAANPPADITYKLTVTAEGGCTAADTVHITVLKSPNIPNAFSPNGDGRNDVWVIRYLDSYADCEVDIYNRYGEHVFHSTGYKQPWDGVYKGKQLPVGSYAYIVNTKRHLHLFVGSVIIVR